MATHFYTISAQKRAELLARTDIPVKDEDIACYVRYTTPLYRFLTPATGDYYYSVIPFDSVPVLPGEASFYSEGVAGEVFPLPSPLGAELPVPSMPIRSLYSTTAERHFYLPGGPAMTSRALPGFDDDEILFSAPTAAELPVTNFYRMYNRVNNAHFYTADPDERANALKNLGYSDEGVGFLIIPAPYSTALFHLYNPSSLEHLYTTDPHDVEWWARWKGYLYERAECGVFLQAQFGTTPLFQLYNEAIHDRLYTTSNEERTTALRSGYTSEKMAGHVYPADSLGSAPYTTPLYRILIG